MAKQWRIIAVSIVAVGLVFFVGLAIINILLKNKVENFLLTRLPKHIVQTHEGIAFDIFQGTIYLDQPQVIIHNKSTSGVHTRFKAEKLVIEDIGYWDYLFNHEIHIDEIKLKNPVITYHKGRLVRVRDSVPKPLLKLNRPIKIDKVAIENTVFSVFDKSRDSMVLLQKTSRCW